MPIQIRSLFPVSTMAAWVLLVAGATAAGAKENPAARDQGLVIWVSSPTDVKYYADMVELYKKKIDGNFAATLRYYGFTEMPDKLSVAFKTGIDAPDIVQIDEMFFSVFLNQPSPPFLDLTERAAEAGLTQAILPQRMTVFQYQGKTYGLPQSVSDVVLYYRKDLFDEEGISPKDIDSWDKFTKIGKKLAKKNRGFLALDWSYFEILLRQRGYHLFGPDGRANLVTPQAVETLEWLGELAKTGVGLQPDRGSIFEPVFFTGDVANNEVMCVISAGWYGLDMIASLSPEEMKGMWRAMPLPVWTGSKAQSTRRTSVFSGQGLLIYEKARDPEAAWKFIRFIMEDPEASALRFLNGNCLTPFRPAWVDTRFNRPDPVFGGQALGGLLIELAQEIPMHYQSPKRAMALNLLREKYWHSVMSETITPRKALEAIQKAIDSGTPRRP